MGWPNHHQLALENPMLASAELSNNNPHVLAFSSLPAHHVGYQIQW
jgi:hypothetical protein